MIKVLLIGGVLAVLSVIFFVLNQASPAQAEAKPPARVVVANRPGPNGYLIYEECLKGVTYYIGLNTQGMTMSRADNGKGQPIACTK